MATKSVSSFRLSQETMERLNYLSGISFKSQGAIIEELIDGYYNGVMWEAFGSDPADDPSYRKNGGTIVTVEEQKALKTVLDRLVGTWKEIGGRP